MLFLYCDAHGVLFYATTKSLTITQLQNMVTINDNDPKVGPLEAPFLKFFTAGSTNGQKVAILLELLGLKYVLRPIDFRNTKENKEEWFLQINPNGKIPTIVEADADGKIFSLAESGALLLYLAEKYDTDHKYSYDNKSPLHWEEVEILFFHASGLNPAQANLNYFRANAPEDSKTIDRYRSDLLRSYQILDDKISKNSSGFLVGDHISLADLIVLPHARGLANVGVDVSQFKHLEKWITKVSEIPQVKKALELL